MFIMQFDVIIHLTCFAKADQIRSRLPFDLEMLHWAVVVMECTNGMGSFVSLMMRIGNSPLDVHFSLDASLVSLSLVPQHHAVTNLAVSSN